MNNDSTAKIIEQFNDAFQRHDPSLLQGLIADDCVIENTDDVRHVGREACLELWSNIATSPGTHFDLEDVSVEGERAIIRWRLWWGPDDASSVRGVNVMRVRHGVIEEPRHGAGEV